MNPHIKLSELIDFLTKLLNTHGDNYIFINDIHNNISLPICLNRFLTVKDSNNKLLYFKYMLSIPKDNSYDELLSKYNKLYNDFEQLMDSK